MYSFTIIDTISLNSFSNAAETSVKSFNLSTILTMLILLQMILQAIIIMEIVLINY
jgi:hypothetical protein